MGPNADNYSCGRRVTWSHIIWKLFTGDEIATAATSSVPMQQS